MDINELLQNFVQETLTATMRHVRRAGEVSEIWVYSQFEGDLMCRPLFKVGDEICQPGQVDDLYEEPVEGSLLDLYSHLSEAIETFRDGCVEVGTQCPTRMIIHFDTEEQEMDSDWSYYPLRAADESIEDVTIFEQWRDHLKTTGEYPADRQLPG